MDTLAVFRSRSEALKVYKLLQKKRIACATVNTPIYLGVGCGISVVFHNTLTDIVDATIKSLNTNSFIGFYKK